LGFSRETTLKHIKYVSFFYYEIGVSSGERQLQFDKPIKLGKMGAPLQRPLQRPLHGIIMQITQ
jgi:hypothetical protein